MSDLVAAALDYVALGWAVFPCSPKNKKPLVEHGFKAASTDPETIKAWFWKWPNAMLAVATGATSGIVVLDVDRDKEKGLDGEASLAALLNGASLPPDLTAVRTPRGGRHIYFRYPEGVTIRNSAGRLAPGVDVRGEGGYVIVPPSVNAAGIAYRWEPEQWGVLYPPPDFMLPKPRENEWRQTNGLDVGDERRIAYGDKAVADECRAVACAPEGSRNDQLNRSAFSLFQLVAGGVLPDGEVHDALMAAALLAGLTAVEAGRTIDSARSAGMSEPRGPKERDNNRPPPTTGQVARRVKPNSDYGADAEIMEEAEKSRADANGAYLDCSNVRPWHDFPQEASPGSVLGVVPKSAWDNGPARRRRRSRDFIGTLQTSKEFMATMHPPEFVVDDLLIAGSTYTMTGRTGSGKTIAALLIAEGVATGGGFCGRMCQQGSVAFFAGENPDNVKMQWFSLCWDLGIDPASLPIHWYAGIFDVNRAIAKVREVLRDIPDLKLVIIDSLQAYFTGEDDSQNMDMLDLAADFREMTEGHPNRPAGIVVAHPVKNAPRDNLLPRGGSALLNELDGNLTTWLDNGMVIMHWQGKYRGVPFDPIEMEAVVVKPEGLVTADGRQMSCTILRPVMPLRKAEITKEATRRKRLALAAIKAKPEISVQEIATAIGRSKSSGQRMVEELLKDKWIKRFAGRLKLTAEGEEALGQL